MRGFGLPGWQFLVLGDGLRLSPKRLQTLDPVGTVKLTVRPSPQSQAACALRLRWLSALSLLSPLSPSRSTCVTRAELPVAPPGWGGCHGTVVAKDAAHFLLQTASRRHG